MSKESIPNIVTGLNIFVGILAIMYAFDGMFRLTIIYIFVGIILDGVDGQLARMLKVETKKGKYLDSIADMFVFCFAPSILLYGLYYDVSKGTSFEYWQNGIVVLVSSFIIITGVYRLARFIETPNNDKYFTGLPTPAGAMAIVLIIIVFYNFYIVMFSSFIISVLMVSNVKYIKFKGNLKIVAGFVIVIETVTYTFGYLYVSIPILMFLSFYITSPLHSLTENP